jgi:hypothetical protein
LAWLALEQKGREWYSQEIYPIELIRSIIHSLSYIIGKDEFPTTSILSFPRYWIAKATPSSTLSRWLPLPSDVAPLPPALPPTAFATSDDHSLAISPLEAWAYIIVSN